MNLETLKVWLVWLDDSRSSSACETFRLSLSSAFTVESTFTGMICQCKLPNVDCWMKEHPDQYPLAPTFFTLLSYWCSLLVNHDQ